MSADNFRPIMSDIQKQAHPNCVMCSSSNDRGLGLKFILTENGRVQASFDCDKVFEGYNDCLHGGITSSLLDSAMTNCLFAHGHQAMTAKLEIRFRHQVNTGQIAIVRAWIERSLRPMYILKAELVQDKQVKVTATGKFMEQSD
ncbi:PaaI family thioesterase [Planctomycetota bacterium]